MALSKKTAWVHIVAFALIVATLYFIVQPTGIVAAGGSVYSAPYFSEFMTSNSAAVMDADGEFSKWVEISNPTDAPLSLTGMGLTDRSGQEMKWRFPAVSIPARGQILVFLSKKGQTDANGALHTSFGLKEKEILYLLNSDGSVVDELAFAQMSADTSMVRRLGQNPEWEVTTEYTPGLPNTHEAYTAYLDSLKDLGSTTVYLNEISPVNRTYVQDEDGEYVDWIELRNYGESTVDLSGWGLSDKHGRPFAWRFPQGTTIGAKGYLLVYCSGKDRIDLSRTLHTGFSLSSSSTTITLANRQGYIVDEVLTQDIPDDASYARNDGDTPGTWDIRLEPTPGLPNTRDSVLSLQKQIMDDNPGLYILQIVARNKGSLELDAESPDWLTLRNDTGADIDLAGYGLSDDPSRPLLWRFPSGSVIEAGGTLTVYADSQDNADGDAVHTSFNLSRLGETVVLATPEREIIDRVVIPPLDPDIAYLRVPSRDGFFYCSDPVPGVIPDTVYDGALALPLSPTPGGIYAAAVTVEPPQAEEGAVVRYTTDGSIPTKSSPVLDLPISVSSNTVLRTRAFRDGFIDSKVATSTYLIGVSHELPVVSIVSDPDGLFSHETGIYAKGPGYDSSIPSDKSNRGANFAKNWERAASVEFISSAGALEYAQDLGIKITGQTSRGREQKSFTLNARNMYGENRIDFNPFSDRDYAQYKNFVLRSSSQDDNRARMRDAMLTHAMAEGTGVLYQVAQPVAVYINGEYWGHYNLRERVNHWMIASFEGVTDEEDIRQINLLEHNNAVRSGTADGWKEILSFLNDNRLTRAENLAWIDERVDIENFFNYAIMEMWCANSDSGNIRWYQVPGGKWKWLLYDLDWAFNTSGGMTAEEWDTITWYTKEKGHGVSSAFSTLLIRRLLEVPELRVQFVEQMAALMNGNLSTKHMLDSIDAFAAEIAPEMPQHYERWSYAGSVTSWEKHVQRLRDWASKRNAKMMTDMKNYFDLSSARMNELFPNGTP